MTTHIDIPHETPKRYAAGTLDCVKPDTIEFKIIQLMSGKGYFTLGDIASASGLPLLQIRAVIYRLRKKGLIHMKLIVGNGVRGAQYRINPTLFFNCF